MRTAIIGAGPAGLFLCLLSKRRRSQDEMLVLEQNPRGATFGFGVVFSDGALEFLRAGEPEVFKLLEAEMERWPEQKIVHRDEPIFIDGNGFSALGRLQLLTILEGLCETAGVRVEHGRKIETLAELSGFDLVVGADGVNSMVRRSLACRLHPRVRISQKQVRLVRNDESVRLPDPHFSWERAWPLRGAPLPLRTRHEHVRRGI